MTSFVNFYSKNRKNFLLITILLLVILFAMPFITTKRMNINSACTQKEDVALYIMQHHELPPNYITKDGYTYIKNHNITIDADTKIGGDTHVNNGKLSKFGVSNNAKLKECDIAETSYTLDARGSYRLVYTCNTKNVRVFYTSDHYSTFNELTHFKLQLTRNIFWIIFACYAVAFIIFYIRIAVLRKKQHKQVLIEETKSN